FHLRECVENVLKAIALHAPEKGLELACHIHPNVPEAVIGDPARLRQILTNLVANAIKFTDQGKVTVTAERSGSADRNLLHFAVQDTGPAYRRKSEPVSFNPLSKPMDLQLVATEEPGWGSPYR